VPGDTISHDFQCTAWGRAAEQVGRSETAQKQLQMYQSQTKPFFLVALDCFTLSP
jgi:hypothetical protein